MQTKPVLLLADSQLLFSQRAEVFTLRNYLRGLKAAKAAYIGAANDDRPEYYQLFTAALAPWPKMECRHIKKSFTAEDQKFLNEAQVILLAGGDVLLGWQTLAQTGMAEVIIKRYYDGAYIIGVSAGAIHLGIAFADEQNQLHFLTRCLPLVIDVHQQNENWARLIQTLRLLNNPYVNGVGIPLGAGLIYHTDHSLEALGKAVWLFSYQQETIKRQLILPASLKTENEVEQS